MQKFTDGLRETFEKDWQAEEEILTNSFRDTIKKAEDDLHKKDLVISEIQGELKILKEEKSELETKYATLEREKWGSDVNSKNLVEEKTKLSEKLQLSEREIARLRSELQQLIMRGEDDHLVFRSAEATLQDELIQLKKKMLRNE